jgi:hypothetical protein
MRLESAQADCAPSRAPRAQVTNIGRACDRAAQYLIVRLAIAMLIGATASSSPADTVRPNPVIVLPHDIVLPVPAMPPSNADPMNPASPGDVLTQRYNNLRTGTTFQTGLDQDAVRDRFGFIGILGNDDNAIEGVVLAQPLFMEKVLVEGRERSAVFIATSANLVYAFDADNLELLWRTPLGKPFTLKNPFPDKDHPNQESVKGCNMVGTQNHDFGPEGFLELGIDSTPVLDLAGDPRIIVSYRKMDDTPDISGTFNMDGMTSSGAQYIAALRLKDGAILLSRRITDDPAFSVSPPQAASLSQKALWNQVHRNRASLLLDGDRVYVAFAGRCEETNPDHFFFKKSYQGWILAFNTDTLALVGQYRTTQQPDGVPPAEPTDDPVAGGGIWQATTGLASDGHGNLYFATGNQYKCLVERDMSHIQCSPPDPAGKNLSNSIVRLRVDPIPGGPPGSISMTPTDWFTPYRKTWLDDRDLDFASAGVVLIPNTRYLVAGGKDGMMYVLDRDNLGKFDGLPFDGSSLIIPQGTNPKDSPPNFHTSGDPVGRDILKRDQVVQKFQAAENQYCAAGPNPNPLYCLSAGQSYPPSPPPPGPGVTTSDWAMWPHIHGTPVFGAFPDGRAFLYLWAEKDFLKSFQWWGRRFDATAAAINVNNINTLPHLGKVATNQSGEAVLAPPYLQDDLTPKGSGSVGMPGGMLALTIDPTQKQRARGVLFASVQRCRVNRDTQGFDVDMEDPAFHECKVVDCQTSTNHFSQCAQQRWGMLRAFNPDTLQELWNNQSDRVDPAFEKFKNYWFVKFVPPMIAHNRVFLPTASRRVLVYGLKP